jgi:pantothenate kinase
MCAEPRRKGDQGTPWINEPFRSIPYRTFTRDEWAALRAGEPMVLGSKRVDRLRSLNDRLSIEEVEAIYLPLSRLLVDVCCGHAAALQSDQALPRLQTATKCRS